MKKTVLILATIFTTVIGTGAANAASTSTGYNPAGDQTINISTQSPVTLPNLSTQSFQLQEQLYQQSGTTVPHSYIWVNVNGTPVIAIDPPSVM